MTVTRNVTRIELNAEEKNILEEALEILKDVNIAMESDRLRYVVDNADMVLYDKIFSEINRIEDYVTRD